MWSGAIQIVTDGEITWMVAMLIVAAPSRGRGIGTQLVQRALEVTGARRLDLVTEDNGPRFYRRS